MSRPFRFKRFTIQQEVSPMKVGTDGVLLGAWCGVRPTDSLALDIGAGTGLVALMLAQRGEDNPLVVDAVEIDAASAGEARANAAASPWADRVKIIHGTVQDYVAELSHTYDLIVSNPPFFSGSLLPPDAGRTAARHTVTLSYGELITCAARLLTPGGRFCVILPHEHNAAFTALASDAGLRLERITAVRPLPDLQPIRALMQFTGGVCRTDAIPLVPDELTIELGGRHDYSPEYKALTRDFYLKF